MTRLGASPIELPGTRPEAVLLLHGLTGTPGELMTLSEALAADGYTVRAPLLPGRGTRPADMDGLSWEDWMRAALREYDALAGRYAAVVVGGVSAGGTMALDLALRRRPAALLLYATVLSIAMRGAYLAPYFWRVVRRWSAPTSDFVDREVRSTAYDPAPVRAVSELIAGMRRVRRRVEEIRAPALVAHAVADRLVPVANARELARRLTGPVSTLLLEGTGHSITADAKRHELASATRAFLAQLFARAP